MDEREFYNFVEETKGIVLSAIRRYMSSQYYHSIDDVAQETYIRVYRGIKKKEFVNERSMNNWIYTIAKNETLRMLKKFGREESKLRKVKELTSLKEKKYLHNNNNINIIEMKEVISTLPEKYKSIFELLLQGFTERQIAEKLSIKNGTVKSRIHRGKELILRSSNSRGIDYG